MPGLDTVLIQYGTLTPLQGILFELFIIREWAPLSDGLLWAFL